jgi:hypothetical protein
VCVTDEGLAAAVSHLPTLERTPALCGGRRVLTGRSQQEGAAAAAEEGEEAVAATAAAEEALVAAEEEAETPKQKAAPRQQGTVAWYNILSGLGAIDSDGEQFAVERADVEARGYRVLRKSRGAVSFVPDTNAAGQACARHVRAPQGEPLNNALVLGAASWQGLKPSMEDRWCREELPGLGAYFGLFDGHGGAQCADYAQKHLHRRIEHAWVPSTPPVSLLPLCARGAPAPISPETSTAEPRYANGGGAAAAAAGAAVHKAMEDGIAELDRAFLHVARRQALLAGSTALLATFCGERSHPYPHGSGQGFAWYAPLGNDAASDDSPITLRVARRRRAGRPGGAHRQRGRLSRAAVSRRPRCAAVGGPQAGPSR